LRNANPQRHEDSQTWRKNKRASVAVAIVTKFLIFPTTSWCSHVLARWKGNHQPRPRQSQGSPQSPTDQGYPYLPRYTTFSASMRLGTSYRLRLASIWSSVLEPQLNATHHPRPGAITFPSSSCLFHPPKPCFLIDSVTHSRDRLVMPYSTSPAFL
jgi:hypothetical protein